MYYDYQNIPYIILSKRAYICIRINKNLILNYIKILHNNNNKIIIIWFAFLSLKKKEEKGKRKS